MLRKLATKLGLTAGPALPQIPANSNTPTAWQPTAKDDPYRAITGYGRTLPGGGVQGHAGP